MATLRNFSNLTKLFNNLTIQNQITIPSSLCLLKNQALSKNFSTTKPAKDLMEFFDDSKNWGVNEVKSGRSWKKDELRIKSNTDLHKLWYVLLKERNMLLSMEEECKRQVRLFPSPERIDKVEESMENLEEVIRERNRAYYLLETGETGERSGEVRISDFGISYYHRLTEHYIPKYLNKAYRNKMKCLIPDTAKEQFLQYYREKIWVEKKKRRTRDFNHVIGLMNRFPNLDMEAVKAQYPDVNIEKAKNSRKYKPRYQVE